MAPKRFWMVNSSRMVVMIGICSTIGVMIVRWGPSNVWLKVVIAFALGQLFLSLSGTSFSPMISAIVLPIILATDTWIYPFSAIVLTIMIVLGSAFRRPRERSAAKRRYGTHAKDLLPV